MKKLIVLFVVLFAVASFAQHSVALKCTASTSTGVTSYNFYKAPCTGTVSGGVCSAEGTFVLAGSAASCSFTDSSVTALQKLSYYATAVCPTCAPSESTPSNHLGVSIPADGQPNPPTGLAAPTISMLQLPGAKTSITAKWNDGAADSTTYKLTGTRQLLWWKWDVTLVQGSKQSPNGTYSLIWTGPRVSAVTLQVCDAQGCKSKSV